ncbi:F-box protein [Candidatus Hepatobacter penaei]|uniref:F-box protein n=1 Tax=Candidatus Hepatobacter penaei TaxID=1274402 RepID=UPI0004F2C97F|nr:F-box protein [Candidatus Hepatobacter penaei]
MDPGASPDDHLSLSTASSHPLPQNFRRAPKGTSEMWQILHCSEITRFSFCLIKKGISLKEHSLLPHHERAPVYQIFEGPVFKTIRFGIDDQFRVMNVDQHPLLGQALREDCWQDCYTNVRTFAQEQYEEQHGPNAAEETDFYVSFFLENIYFLPDVSLEGVNTLHLRDVNPGVNWEDLKAPNSEIFFLKNRFPMWRAPNFLDMESKVFVMTYPNFKRVRVNDRIHRVPVPYTILFHADGHLTAPPDRSHSLYLRMGFWGEVMDDHPFSIAKEDQTPFRFTFFPQTEGQTSESTKIKAPEALTLCDLPPELIQGGIMPYLDTASILALSQTCTYMRDNVQIRSKGVDAFVYAPALATAQGFALQDLSTAISQNKNIDLTCALLNNNGRVTNEEPWTMEVEERHLSTNNVKSIFREVLKLGLCIKSKQSGMLIAKGEGILVGHCGQIFSDQYIAALSGIVDEGVRRYFRLKRQHAESIYGGNKGPEVGGDLVASEAADPGVADAEAGPCL